MEPLSRTDINGLKVNTLAEESLLPKIMRPRKPLRRNDEDEVLPMRQGLRPSLSTRATWEATPGIDADVTVPIRSGRAISLETALEDLKLQVEIVKRLKKHMETAEELLPPTEFALVKAEHDKVVTAHNRAASNAFNVLVEEQPHLDACIKMVQTKINKAIEAEEKRDIAEAKERSARLKRRLTEMT